MFIFDMTNWLILLLMLIITVLLIFLAQELKRSYIVAIPLFAYLGLAITHVTQLVSLSQSFIDYRGKLITCIAIDFVFVAITFFAYLWADDLEAKDKGKKSIDNSLDWMWKKI